MTASEQSQDSSGEGPLDSRVGRRWLLKSGAMLVPTIVTLHARSALAQSPEGSMGNPLRVLNQAYGTGGQVYAGARYAGSPVPINTFEAHGIDPNNKVGGESAGRRSSGGIDRSGRPSEIYYREDPDTDKKIYYTWRD